MAQGSLPLRGGSSLHLVAGGDPDLTGVTRLSPRVSPRLRAARDADAWVAQQGVVSPGGG